MRKLLVLSLFGLFLSGCKEQIDYREHEIVCLDAKTQQSSYDIIAPSNVYAFVVKGHSVLSYKDSNKKSHIIFLSKNDCVIY